MLTKNFSSKNLRSQLSNAVSRNVIRLLDQKLRCFKDKSYFSNFFEFYNNQRDTLCNHLSNEFEFRDLQNTRAVLQKLSGKLEK